MNITITFFLALLLIGCRDRPQPIEIPEQNPTVEKPRDSIDYIKAAWTHATQKRSAKKLDSASVTYDCAGERAGTVKFYRDQGQVLLISHVYNEYSHFSAAKWYLVEDGKLIFVLEDERTWGFVRADATEDKVVQRRFYARDGKPFNCLVKKFSVFSDAEKPDENTIPNKIIECDGFARVEKDFKQLYVLRAKSGKIDCLAK